MKIEDIKQNYYFETLNENLTLMNLTAVMMTQMTF